MKNQVDIKTGQKLKAVADQLRAVRHSLQPGAASVPNYKPLTLLQILDYLKQAEEAIDDIRGENLFFKDRI